MAEPGPERGDAAAFIRDAPLGVHMALLGLLSSKWILRMRSVCKAWRDKLCDGALLSRLHRDEPPRLLICFDRAACPDRHVHLTDYCVESLDLCSGTMRHVFRFTDHEFYLSDEAADAEARDAAPIEATRVDYARMEENRVDGLKQVLLIHASLDGYLLVSFSFLWFIVNPATRRFVKLPDLAALHFDVVGFYEHGPSGNYRVLCLSRSNNAGGEPERAREAPTCSYHVISVRPVVRRSIGRPLSPDARKDHGLRFGVEMASTSPPIQLKHNMHLHWPPQESQGYQMLVFDTGNNVFSWKATPPAIGQDMRLLEFPNGKLGLSVSDRNFATLELWCLEDYKNEHWFLRNRIQLALQVQQMPVLRCGDPWIPAVVSPEGDVLIVSRHGLFHCDRNGDSVRGFWFNQVQSSQRVLPVRHVLRESLLLHHGLFPEPIDGPTEPPFFNWLCSDPSW